MDFSNVLVVNFIAYQKDTHVMDSVIVQMALMRLRIIVGKTIGAKANLDVERKQGALIQLNVVIHSLTQAARCYWNVANLTYIPTDIIFNWAWSNQENI